MKKSLNVKLIGYQVVGLTALALYDGSEGTIPMEPVNIMQQDYPTDQQIREAINDNGFGVEFMEGAIVRVDALYELGAKTYGDTQFINLSGYSDKHVGRVLSNGHPEAPVNVWELDEADLKKICLF